MSQAIPEVTMEFLQSFADAWNRHDIDALMSFMTDDCVFEASGGPEKCGARHFVQGERGVSEWTFTGTRLDGTRVEVNGCDLFTFRDGKIAVKNSYRKNRPPLPAHRG
jgi:ketosteroid isomerase-like protein